VQLFAKLPKTSAGDKHGPPGRWWNAMGESPNMCSTKGRKGGNEKGRSRGSSAARQAFSYEKGRAFSMWRTVEEQIMIGLRRPK